MEDDIERNDKEAPLLENEEKWNGNSLDEEHTINGFKDVFFLFLFFVNLLFLGAIALTYGGVTLFNSSAEYLIVKGNGSEIIDTSHDNIPLKIVSGLLVILVSASFISFSWIYLLSKVATLFMNFIMTFMTSGTAILGIIVLLIGYPYFAFLLVLLSLGILAISFFFQHRIEFASLNLQIACKAILDVPLTFYYSFLMLLLQGAYLIIWTVATVGFATNTSNITKKFQGKEYYLDQCSTYKYSSSFEVDGISLTCNGGTCYSCICVDVLVSSSSPCFTPKLYYSTMVFLVLSLFWVNSVISNIVHCITSSAVYSWWTTGNCSEDQLQLSFHKITTKSLGSICFGSLLTAVVRTIRSFVYFLVGRTKRRANSTSSENTVLASLNRISQNILISFSTILDRLILYFNRYAFCFVAIYGISYLHAAKAAVDLFKARGLTALFNDDLIDLIILISEFLVALLCLGIAYIHGRVVGITGLYLYLFEIFGFFTGLVISIVILSTIQSAVTTVYVSFAKNPADFEVNFNISVLFPA
jgi:hypothetical protein